MSEEHRHTDRTAPPVSGDTTHTSLPAVVGETLGDFRLLRQIGEGGMGLVYEAEQRHPHRLVALKLIRGGPFVDEHQIKLFEREAAALARLKHPGIATIYEMGRTSHGQPFFAMELVRGVPLSDYAQGSSRDTNLTRTLRARLTLFIRICDAVNYAHQRGVIHRDLKPSNILVTASGRRSGPPEEQVPEIKILDFGLARITDPDAKVTHSLVGSGVHGTLAYMSPEQALGNPDEIDVRSDVYSLGVILYELMSGRLPYETAGMPPLNALRVIAEAVPPPPSRVSRERMDPDLDTIAMRALEKEPGRRYATALALAEDIERYLSDQPILARPPTATYQIRKLVKRHKAAFGSVAALVGLLAAFAFVMTIERNRAVRAEQRAEAEAETARHVSQFLVDLFEVSDPTEALGQRVTAREILDQGAQRIEWELAAQPVVRATLMETMGKAYEGLGLHAASERLLRAGVDTLTKLQGPRHPQVAAMKNTLAGLLIARGEYTAAEPLIREVLQFQQANLGEHLQVAETLSNLATMLNETGRYPEAEAAYKEALALRRKLHGEAHRDVAESLNNLATFYHQTKADFASARPLLDEALAVNRKVLGPEHPEVATTLNNIGMLLVSQGQYPEAETALRESLALRRKMLGVDHALTANSLNNLGYLFSVKGDHPAAEPFYREALAIRQRVFGSDHPLVANTMNNLASSLSGRQDYEGAERIYRESLAIRERLFGETHRAVSQSLNNIGTILLRTNRLDEAERLFQRAVAIARELLGPDHPETSNYLFNLARAARAKKDADRAASLFGEVVAMRRKRLPDDHPDIASALFQQSGTLVDLQRYSEGEPLALEAYRINSAKLGAAHASTVSTRDLLLRLYTAWGRAQEAAKYSTPAR